MILAKTIYNKYLVCFIYALCTAFLSIPFWSAAYPRTVDLINHLSRQYVRYYYDNNEHYREFYQYEWLLIPNLANDIFITSLLPFFSIYTVSKLLLTTIVALWLYGGLLLHRVIWGKLSYVPLLIAPFIYNAMLTWGFTGTLLTQGYAILVLALWIKLDSEHIKTIYKVPILILACFSVYLGHLFVFGLLGLVCGFYEYNKLLNNGQIKDIKYLIRKTLYLLLIFSLGLIHFIGHLITSSVSHGSIATNLIPNSLVKQIISTIDNKIYPQDIYVLCLVVIFVIVAALLNTKHFKIELPKTLLLSLIAVLTFSLAFPEHFLGVYLISIRIPVFFLLLLFATIKVTKAKESNICVILPILFLFLVTYRVNYVTQNWITYSENIDHILEKTDELIVPGKKLLIAFNQEALSIPEYNRKYLLYSHIGSYFTIENSVYVPTTFTGMGSFFQAQKKYSFIDPPQPPSVIIDFLVEIATQPSTRAIVSKDRRLKYLADWPESYDYLLVIHTDSYISNEPKLPFLRKSTQSHDFTLYNILGSPQHNL